MHQVSRSAILDKFLGRDPVRLVTVESPSGSGKSTLLRQLQAGLSQRGQRPVLLQSQDGTDAEAFVLRILEGLSAAGLPIELPPPGESLEGLTNRLIQALRARTAPLYLLIDDFQKVKSPATIRLLTRLVYLDPTPNLTLIIASRVATDIPVATLRLSGEIVELGLDALRFSETEAEALRALEAETFDPATWRAFNEKVNGWAVALRLALILLRDRRIDQAGLMGFSGKQRDMAAYLSQLIVAGIAPGERPLLLAAAAFDALRPDMLVAVLGADAAQRLLGLIETLALPMDDAAPSSLPSSVPNSASTAESSAEGQRLHSVVADYLRLQAEAEGINLISLQQRAARYYQSRGHWRGAMRYALRSGDLAFAAGVLEQGGGWRLIYRGEAGTLAQFADLMDLPPQHFAAHPRTALGLAITAAKRGEIDLALQIFTTVGAMIPSTDPRLCAEFRLIDALMNLYSDRRIPPELFSRLEADIADIAKVDPARLALTQNLLCFSSLQEARFEPAIRFGRLSAAAFRTAMSDFGAAHLPLHIGQAEYFSGKIGNARSTLAEHLTTCTRELGPGAELTLMTGALLEEVDLEQGAPPRDPGFLAEAFDQLGKRDSWFDPLASIVVSRLRLALIEGQDAETILRDSEGVANRRNYRRLLRLVDLLRIEILLRSGQPKEAARLLDLLATAHWDASEQDPVNLRGAPIAALQARLDLARGQPQQALLRLDRLLSDPQITCNIPRLIRLSLLKLRALLDLDHPGQALRELERLALSQRLDQYALTFAEEAKGLAAVLDPLLAATEAGSIIARRLAPCAALLTRTQTSPALAEAARLTPSESEILLRLERGLANKEIARALQISDNTVKYHLTNIFRKLEVTTRTAAITRARSSGILAACHHRAELGEVQA
jgi:LuxR family transcriptional regulator, maltose regulon positive regulatory protein